MSKKTEQNVGKMFREKKILQNNLKKNKKKLDFS